jgi:hypothetical protein
MKALLRAGFRPLIASALYLPAALTGRTLLGAALYAALLLAANVALQRDEAEGKRAAGYLTALALLMAAPLALPPERANALLGLLIAWLTAVSLTAGPRALFHCLRALRSLPARPRPVRQMALPRAIIPTECFTASYWNESPRGTVRRDSAHPSFDNAGASQYLPPSAR